MREWVSQMRRGLMELCLLNILQGNEGYGYQIVQQLGSIDELSVSESTVYPILARLRKDGYLKVRTAPSPGGPPRRYFSLTRSGSSYLHGLNEYWEALNVAISKLRQQTKAAGGE